AVHLRRPDHPGEGLGGRAVHLHPVLIELMRILGISAFYHDSAAALVVDGRIVAAVQEERFTRIKQDAGFPRHAIDYCLAEAGVGLDQVDCVVFYEKPFLKFERLLETMSALHRAGSPRSRPRCRSGSARSCSRRTCWRASSRSSIPASTPPSACCSPSIT